MADEKTIKIKVELVDDVAKKKRDEWTRLGQNEGRQRAVQIQNMQRVTHKAARLNKKHQTEARSSLKNEIRDRREVIRLIEREERANEKAARQQKSRDRSSGKGGGSVGFGGGFARGTGAHGMMKRMGKRTGGFSAGGLAGYAVGSAVSTIALGAVAAVGAIVSAVVAQIPASDAAYRNYARAAIDVLGISKGADHVKRRAFAGAEYGYTPVESVQQMRQIARATGSIDLLTPAQKTARAMGMDVSEVGELMGNMTRSGTNLQTNKGMRVFERVMTQSVSAGLDKSRAGEHLSAVQSLVQAAQGRTAGSVDVAGISGLLAFFSKSGQAGLQGARGAEVLTSFDNVLKQAGAGGTDATSAFMMRAMGFGTGGNADYYSATQSAQRGILGEGGSQNLLKVFRQHAAEKGTGKYANLELSRMTGLSLDQIEGVRKVMGSGGANVSKQIAEITQKSLPMDEQIHDVLSTDIAQRLMFMAEEEVKQVAQGEDVAKTLDDMRGAINSFIHDVWPIMVEVLKVIRDCVVELVSIMRAAFGGLVEGTMAKHTREGIQEDIQALRAGRESGDLTEAEYRKSISELQEKAEKARKSLLEADDGPLTNMFDSLPGMSGAARRREQLRTEELDNLRSVMTELGVRQAHGTGGVEESAEALRTAQDETERRIAARAGRMEEHRAAVAGRAAQAQVVGDMLAGPSGPVVVEQLVVPQSEDAGAVRHPATVVRSRQTQGR